MSNATTEGIRVTVRSFYVPEQSAPRAKRYVFAYTVRIANEGELTAQLRTRHWIITDAEGNVDEVRGDGVVGAQPTLNDYHCRPNEETSEESCRITVPAGASQAYVQVRGFSEATYQLNVEYMKP